MSDEYKGQPECASCGGLHYGSPTGRCVYICERCGKDIRIDALNRCACPPLPTFTPRKAMTDPAQSEVIALRAKVVKLEAEHESLELALAAQEKKYEDCPHPKGEQYWPCGCSYDRPSDVCMVHAPQLKAATQENAELRAQVERLKAENMRLKARCSMKEWKENEYAGRIMSHTIQAHSRVFDAIIAARAATKGEDNAGTK